VHLQHKIRSKLKLYQVSLKTPTASTLFVSLVSPNMSGEVATLEAEVKEYKLQVGVWRVSSKQ